MTSNRKPNKAYADLCILITGAGFDIGKALAIRCAQQGAHVILLDKDNHALDAVYDEITAANYCEPTILHLDMQAFAGETAELIRQQILNDHQKLDALIHTASAAFPLTPANLLENEVLNKALNMLHTLPHQITRELYAVLKRADHPSVIFTSHFSAHTNKSYWGYHAGAFAALEALSRQWAADTRNLSFSINSIDPGLVKTAIRKKHYPAEDQSHLREANDEAILTLYLNLLSKDGKSRSGEHFSLPGLR
jgi:NAD(P)-dependent dehydrogenase (short-subunit alcohol dehydrogenase family)